MSSDRKSGVVGAAVLVDDDGVLVLASARALVREHARRPFDHAFPVELLCDAATGTACGWMTGAEGEVALSVQMDPEAVAGTRCGFLRIVEADELLMMPYSAYTFACAHDGGRPPSQAALCGRFAVPAALYEVRVSPAAPTENADLGFTVSLCVASGEMDPPEAIPKIADLRSK